MMFCRRITWFICFFVTMVMAAAYSDPHSIKGSSPIVPAQENKDTAAVHLEPPSKIRSPAATESGASPSAQPHSRRSRSPVSTATSSATCSGRPLNVTAVSLLRKLSAEEKGKRLIEVTDKGTVDELETLLAAGADVGSRDVNTWTPMHFAALRGDVEIVKCLLRNGALVDIRDITQQTPLHVAASSGNAAVAQLLVAFSADPHARRSDGSTPLHMAALSGRAAVVRVLVAASADVNARDNKGRTPLHRVAWNGSAEVVRALLGAGADRRAKDDTGRTPLDIARENNRQQIIDLLT
ncbi:ankyrin repeat and protein kinase domain-containing protein 1-like [Schistocerca serialis cubense]|uniref:ankyrin repeat and protein kinase domain-containing protein 1-like n=1 Tax=Schistocerca serialis cubense TaxID=2023355 RepID=UPI00214E0E7B|nr:ankyrin repeat and protein kinase domain-containing protein 1-like [Schistocerca serialis cubense]